MESFTARLARFRTLESSNCKEHENSLLSWASLPDADIINAGKIEFRDAKENSTELHA